MLVGEAALLRGVTEPERLSTGFIARLGDPVPELLGTEEIARTELTGQLLRFVLARVVAREDGPPSHVTLTVPAAWGEHHRQLMTQVAAQAGLADVGLLASPVAVAIHFAAQSTLDPGAAVAVFDLGGSTLACAVVRRTGDGYELLGRPQVDESVGGNVFDDVVVKHVIRSLGNAYTMLDRSDPAMRSALTEVRADAVAAKEQLSTEVETTVTVKLPGLTKEIRYTRGEFEGAIRIPLLNAVGTLEHTVTSAGLTPQGLAAVLLAGGSSAVPLVSQLVGSDLGVDVVTDANPRLAAGLGAAMSSARRAQDAALVAAPPPAVIDLPTLPPDDAAYLLAKPEVVLTASPEETGVERPADVPMRAAPGVRPSLRALSDRDVLAADYAGNRKRGAIALLVAVLAVAAVVVGVLLVTRGGDDGPAVDTATSASLTDTESESATSEVSVGPALPATAVSLPTSPGEAVTGIAATGSGLVAVGGTVDPAAATVWLNDGTTWITAGRPGLLAADRVWTLSSVSAGPGQPILATGWSAATADASDPAKRRGELWVSADGQTWVPATLPEIGELTAVTRIASGYLAAGQSYAADPTDGDAVTLFSTDGARWAQVAATGLDGPGPFGIAGLVADPAGGIVALAARLDGAVTRSGLWRSPDGAAWTFDRWVPAAGLGVADARGVALDAAGGLVVVGEQSGPSGGPVVWRTENGELVPHPVDLGAGGEASAVVVTANGLVVAGEVASVGAAAWSVG